MARERKTFGPLLYGTLLLATVGAMFAGILRLLERRSAVAEAHSFDAAAAIAPLLPGVTAGEPLERVRWIQALANTVRQHGPSDAYAPALAALRQALRDEEWPVRAAAAEALGAFGPSARPVADALIGALEDGEPDVRIAAAGALLRIGGEGRDAALRLLGDVARDPATTADRGAVIGALLFAGEEGQDAAARALAGLLSDGDASVRAEVVRCAPSLGPAVTRLMPLVLPLLDSDEPDVRYDAAMVAVLGLDQDAAPDPRLDAILEAAVRDASLALDRRQEALTSLYAYGTAGGMAMGMGAGSAGFPPGPPRRSVLRRCGLELARQLSDEDPDVRFAAAMLLQMIDPETLSGKGEAPGDAAP
jgi:HEAT repeat protein